MLSYKSSSLFCTAALLLAAVLSSVATSTTLAAALDREERRVLNCPADKEKITFDDCDFVTYGASAGLSFAGPLIMAIGTLFTFFFFYCFRYCCKCCGSSKQTEGCCCACGNESGAPARYSYFEILRVKIYSVAAAIVAIVMLVLGMVSAAKAKDGLSGLFDAAGNVGQVLVNEIDRIGQKLTVSRYDSNTDTFTNFNLLTGTSQGLDLKYAVGNVSEDIKKSVKDNTDPARDGSDTASTVLFIIVLIPCLCMGLNVVFAFLNIRRWGPMINSVFLFIFMFILWIIHGTIAVSGLVFSDVCAEIKGLADQEKNVVSAFIECPTSLLDDARNSFRELEDTEAKRACERMNNTCVIPTSSNSEFVQGVADGRIFDCPADFLNCTAPTFSRLLNYSENTLSINGSVYSVPNAEANGYICRNTAQDNCTIARCAETCTFPNGTRSATGKVSANAITAFRAAAVVVSVFADIGARFYVCDSLLALVMSEISGPCQDISKGLFDSYMSTGVILMFSIFSVYLCSWGSKRFISLNEAGKLQRGLDDGVQEETRPPPVFDDDKRLAGY